MNNTSGLDLLMRIDNLLSSELRNILDRERGNTNHIHLYKIGVCWAAFDKSAFLVEQMTNVRELPEIFQLQDHPFPLVMHLLDEKQFHVISKERYAELRNNTYTHFLCTSIDSKAYNSWYRETAY